MATFNTQVLQQLATIHANQTQVIMPGLTAILAKIAALDSKLIALDAKIDAIALQVTPQEMGDFNPDNAVIG